MSSSSTSSHALLKSIDIGTGCPHDPQKRFSGSVENIIFSQLWHSTRHSGSSSTILLSLFGCLRTIMCTCRPQLMPQMIAVLFLAQIHYFLLNQLPLLPFLLFFLFHPRRHEYIEIDN